MPEPNNAQTETAEVTTPSDSPPTEAPTSADEFRFSSGPYTGLTASEAVTQQQQTIQNLEQQNQQIVGAVQQYVQQQQQMSQTQTSQADPDLWITDPAKAQAALQQQVMGQVQQYVNQAGQPLVQGQAALAKSASQNDPRYRDIWTNYGTEVESIMQRAPANSQINVEMWNQAAKLVKSEHIDELVQNKALEVAASLPQTETGRTVATHQISEPQSDALTTIRESSYGKSNLAHYSDAKLIDQAQKMGHTIEEYASMVDSTAIVSHPNKPGEWSNPNLVKE